MGPGGQHKGFSAALEVFHDLCASRHDGEVVAAQPSKGCQEKAYCPDRPPVEEHGMGNDAYLTRMLLDERPLVLKSVGRVVFLDPGHRSSFRARVILELYRPMGEIWRNHY